MANIWGKWEIFTKSIPLLSPQPPPPNHIQDYRLWLVVLKVFFSSSALMIISRSWTKLINTNRVVFGCMLGCGNINRHYTLYRIFIYENFLSYFLHVRSVYVLLGVLSVLPDSHMSCRDISCLRVLTVYEKLRIHL